MTNKWLDALKEKESKHNTAAALHVRTKTSVVGPGEIPKTPECRTDRTDKITKWHKEEDKKSEFLKTRTDKTDKNTEAEYLGLVATWSIEFGYISMHDPTTGEWHDLRTKDAPDWTVREAFKRKELYREGNRKAYRLTSREIGEVLEAGRVPEPEGIVEDHPIEAEGDDG